MNGYNDQNGVSWPNMASNTRSNQSTSSVSDPFGFRQQQQQKPPQPHPYRPRLFNVDNSTSLPQPQRDDSRGTSFDLSSSTGEPSINNSNYTQPYVHQRIQIPEQSSVSAFATRSRQLPAYNDTQYSLPPRVSSVETTPASNATPQQKQLSPPSPMQPINLSHISPQDTVSMLTSPDDLLRENGHYNGPKVISR